MAEQLEGADDHGSEKIDQAKERVARSNRRLADLRENPLDRRHRARRPFTGCIVAAYDIEQACGFFPRAVNSGAPFLSEAMNDPCANGVDMIHSGQIDTGHRSLDRIEPIGQGA